MAATMSIGFVSFKGFTLQNHCGLVELISGRTNRTSEVVE